jgi:hypothetical protein
MDLETLNKKLNEYESLVGLPILINQKMIEAAEEYLVGDWAEIRNKSPEELLVAACILTDYAGLLQKVMNKEKSIIHYCKERIRKLVGVRMSSMKAYSFEERECLALSEHAFGNQLHYKKTEAELRLSRIEGLNYTVKNLADKLESLGKIKIKVENGKKA